MLLMSPIAALFLGLLRMVPTRVGYLVLMLGFIALPVWIVWRRSVSTDPTEPVFHLHRYALYALFPYVVFSVVRIPMFYMFDLVYWAPWQTFGFGATGNPVGFYPSLLAGSALYSLQGFSLAMGFYTLFKRHTLLNGMLYFFVFISSLYSFIFPVLLLRGSKPGLPFHFTNYWAHLWMGLTAVFIPVLFMKVWPRLRARARTATVFGLALIWLTPYAFAFAQAGLWQFSTQARLERAAYDAIKLQVGPSATKAVAGDQARYALDLKIGPREYVTYSHSHKAIGAEDVSISGQLMHQGSPIAWCSGAVGSLRGLASVRDPEKYFPALERINHTTIPVTCAGSAETANEISADEPVTFVYTAQMRLTGERTTAQREFGGSVQTMLSTG
ncbi:MAG TPA: hypothetical protein VK735_43020 [Pseudonocardia sp.]|uniref:hypothetical protein n=1 Tax=Pseudonocardia sp. TaxID=60912 RepID=UPI002CD18B17|nr:hypothetical protein [Pseudonocardia sp.]HTF54261.1 hypothetical protein [Pseudonocardia sp.]